MGRNKDSIKKVLNIICIFSSILIVISLLVLLTNLNQNKGIVPFMFFFTTLFFLVSLIIEFLSKEKLKKTSYARGKTPMIFNRNIAFQFLWFIISFLAFMISLFVFWF